MAVRSHAAASQAAFHAMQWASIESDDPSARLRLLHQHRHTSAYPGDTGHFRQPGSIEAQGEIVGQLRDVGTAGAGVNKGKGSHR
ncbi:hypothetical protein D3C78_1505090 [compost metagenome]